MGTNETDFAILDVQWTHRNDEDLLAVATSVGKLAFYRLQAGCGNAELVCLSSKSVADPSTLVLSLAWHPVHAHFIGMTLSDGSVSICESMSGELWSKDAAVRTTCIHQHELEAWMIAFIGASNIVLSGGDDAVLKCSYLNEQQEPSFAWQDRKIHQAGVTAIVPLTPALTLTGSYDDNLRLISHPVNVRPRCLAEHNLGGGVWRLKILNPSNNLSRPDMAGAEWNRDDMPGSQRFVRKSLYMLS